MSTAEQSQQIIDWLQKDVKLKRKINDLNSDFQSGFLFKEILFKLGYNIPQEFYDKKDKAMMQQNYMYLKEFCNNNFGLQLKSSKPSLKHQEYLYQLYEYFNQGQNSILKQRSGTQTKLNKLKTTKKQDLMQQYKMTDQDQRLLQHSYSNVNKHIGTMPPKIMKIEEQLEKFREEKIRHEFEAKQLKQQEEEDLREFRQEQRQTLMETLKAHNTLIKENEKRIYHNWKITQDVKENRLEDDRRLQAFLTGKIVRKLKEEKDFERKDFDDGLDYFYQNCQRQGIDLNHDPDEEKKEVKKAQFSKQATMMKIKERTKVNAEARKARTQRKNKMLVDQMVQQEKVEKQKKEQDFLEGVFQQCMEENILGWQQQDIVIVEKIQKENRVNKSNKQNDDLMKYFEEQGQLAQQREDENKEKRKEEIRKQDIMYMEQGLERKIRRKEKHTKQCGEVMDLILDLVEVCYQDQKKQNQDQINQTYWDQLTQRFINKQPFTDEKVFKIFEQQQQQQDDQEGQQQQQDYGGKKRLEDLCEYEFGNYYNGLFQWAPSHDYQDEQMKVMNRPFNNHVLGDFLCNIVDSIHPKQPVKPRPQDLPQNLPLKISLVGNQFAGKKTMANFLKEKYQLEFIDPQNAIKEAILLAYPPEEDENDKKKKKKDAKKQQEEEKPENEELKALGFQLNDYVNGEQQQVPDSLVVQVILSKLKELFPQKNGQELLDEIEQAEESENKRQEDILKQLEEAKKKQQKKGGKDAKKGKKEEEVEAEEEKSEQELLKEKLDEKKICGYSKGFVLFNFPTTLQQAKLLEEALTGFVVEGDRLNQVAEDKKEIIADLAAPQEKQEDELLWESGLDLYIQFQTDIQVCQSRADSRRIDQQTEIVYNMVLDPPQDQKIVDRLKELDSEKDNIEKYGQHLLENQESLYQFLQGFGVNLKGDNNKENDKIQALQVVEGGQSLYNNFTCIEQVLEPILQQKQSQIQELKEQLKVTIEKEQQEKELLQQKQEQEEEEKQKQQEQEKEGDENQEQQKQQGEEELNKIEEPIKEEEEIEQEIQQQYENIIEVLNKDMQGQVVEMWEEIQKGYQKDCQGIFLGMIKHREQIGGRASDVQGRFLQIMEKKDDKQYKMQQFQNFYNQYLEHHIRNSNNKFSVQQQQEIQDQLDLVYEALWDTLEVKKNLAQEERNNIVCSGWIESEMEQVFRNYLKLFQTEINKLHEIIEIFFYIMDTMEKRPINEVQEHVILEPFKNENPSIEDLENGSYPKIQVLYDHYLQTIDTMHDTIKDMRLRFQRRRLGRNFAKLEDLTQDPKFKMVYSTYQNILQYEKMNLKIRGLILKNTLIQRIKELRNLGDILYNKMDDWIIFGLKAENDVIYSGIKEFKSAIQQQQSVQIQQLKQVEISEVYRPFRKWNIGYQNNIQHIEEKKDYRLSIQQLQVIKNELQTIQLQNNTLGQLDVQALLNIIVRRKNYKECQKNLCRKMLQLNDQQVKEGLYRLYLLGQGVEINSQSLLEVKDLQVEELKIGFNQVVTCMCLMGSPVPTEQNIQDYKEALEQENGQNSINFQEFIKVGCWFDEFEGDSNLYDEYTIDRNQYIKTILFELYANNNDEVDIAEYLQELVKFGQVGQPSFWDILFQE